MRKKTVAISLIALLFIAACGALLWRHLRPAPADSLTLYGNVDIRQVDLAFRVGGRIEKVLVEEGERVAAGQPLAVLEKDLLAAARDEASASAQAQRANLDMLLKGYRAQEVEQARAKVASARAVDVNASANYARVSALARRNAVSRKELDSATAAQREAAASLRQASENLDMLEAGYREEDIRQQEARVKAADAALATAEIRLADATLKAPEQGVILSRARESGAIVGEGQTVYTLTLSNPVWLRAYVNETELGLIRPGMPVKIAVDAAPGKFFDGQVGFISPTAEFTPKTVETRDVRTSLVYRIRVIARDPENIMRQGMPVTVIVPLRP